MSTVFGYPYALILRDSHGEFQVRDAVSDCDGCGTRPMLNWARIHQAIRNRQEDIGPPERPVY